MCPGGGLEALWSPFLGFPNVVLVGGVFGVDREDMGGAQHIEVRLCSD